MILVSYQRQNTDAVTFGTSLLFHILLEVLDVCVKCMGMLQRLKIGFLIIEVERWLREFQKDNFY